MITSYLLTNVLNNEQRRKLIKDSKPLLFTRKELQERYKNEMNYPGKQTQDDLHLKSDFTWVHKLFLYQIYEYLGLRLEIEKSWVNWTNGKKSDIAWHTHPGALWSAVYYMKTFPFSSGTLFRTGFMKAPQNSILIFPANLEHTAPTAPFRFDRYTMALDLIPAKG